MFKNLAFFMAVSFFVISCGGSDYQKAVSYQKDGEYDKAITLYNKSISANKYIAESEKNKGDIYFGKKDFKRALACYKHSLEVNPEVAMEHISKFLSDHDSEVRDITKKMLAGIKNDNAKAKIFEMISEMLKSDKQYQILDALSTLANFNNFSNAIVKDTVSLLDNNNSAVKDAALNIIPNMKDMPESAAALEKIFNILNSSDGILSAKAATTIEKMADNFAPYTEKLIELYKNAHSNLKNLIKNAINNMKPLSKEQAVTFKKYLNDDNPEVKKLVLGMYKKMGQDADILVPDFILLLEDKNPEIVSIASNMLESIKKASVETVPELIKLLDSPSQKIKIAAISELGNIGSEASAAIEPLSKLTKDENKETKRASSFALSQIQK